MTEKLDIEEERFYHIISEPGAEYSIGNNNSGQLYVDPLVDWAFKRIFTTEAHKEVTIAFLNEVLAGKRQIVSITFGKNEYPGEIKDDRGVVFDFNCTDVDGATFLVEVQKYHHKNFKERSVFYASRYVNDQAKKGKKWKYNLKEVYVIVLLENFCLPDTIADEYQHDVSLCYTKTGKVFYDKLNFIYIEMMKFTKKESELKSALDQWIYALKHARTMKEESRFLNAPGLVDFFYLAKYANLTKEELNMNRAAQKIAWDNYSIMESVKESAKESGKEEGLEMGLEMGLEKGALARGREIARSLKVEGIDTKIISITTGLSIDEIIAL